MYESTFWQQWDPLDWCYGDFLYGDPKLDEEPYKLYTSSDPHPSIRKRRMYLKLSLAHSGGGGWLVVVVLVVAVVAIVAICCLICYPIYRIHTTNPT